MRRTGYLVSDAQLAYAHRWEAIRAGHFDRLRWPERAEECRQLANLYASRMESIGVIVEPLE